MVLIKSMSDVYKPKIRREELRGESKRRKKYSRPFERINRLSYLEEEQIPQIILKFFDNNKFKEQYLKGIGKIYQGKISGVDVELYFNKRFGWKLYLQSKYENKLENELEKEDKLKKTKERIVGIILS